MNETIKLGLILLIITAVAGGVLAVSNSFTAPIIAEIENKEVLCINGNIPRCRRF